MNWPILTSTIVAALGCCTPSWANATFDFATIPASGSIAGPRSVPFGWGYIITNQDGTNWVSADTLNTSAGFVDGTYDSSIFDSPVIGPGASVTRIFIANTAGLAKFTWNATAPTNDVNAGNFTLNVSWYTMDPNTCGFTCVFGGPQQNSQ